MAQENARGVSVMVFVAVLKSVARENGSRLMTPAIQEATDLLMVALNRFERDYRILPVDPAKPQVDEEEEDDDDATNLE